MIWNPHATTLLGQPLPAMAPPVLRVWGDGLASTMHHAMAQAAFARFCATTRTSQAPNPSERGRLPDGTFYRISTVGNSSVMEIWPSSQNQVEGTGIQFDLVTPAGVQTFLLSPEPLAGTKRHAGSFGIRRLEVPLAGGVAVHADPTGKSYVAFGKRSYRSMPRASQMLPLDTAAAGQATGASESGGSLGVELTDFAFQGRDMSTHFRPCHSAFIHTNLKGEQFAVSVKMEGGAIVTSVASLAQEAPTFIENSLVCSMPRLLSVDDNGRNGVVQYSVPDGSRYMRLRFSEAGCFSVGDAGDSDWGDYSLSWTESVDAVVVSMIGCSPFATDPEYLCPPGTDTWVEGSMSHQPGIINDGHIVEGAGSSISPPAVFMGVSDVKTYSKNLAGFLRNGSTAEQKAERTWTFNAKTEGARIQTDERYYSFTAPIDVRERFSSSAHGYATRQWITKEYGVEVEHLTERYQIDSDLLKLEYSDGRIETTNEENIDETQKVIKRNPLFFDSVTGISAYYRTEVNYSGGTSFSSSEPLVVEKNHRLIITRKGVQLHEIPFDPEDFTPGDPGELKPGIELISCWARDPKTEVVLLQIYRPDTGDSWSYLVSYDQCVELRSVLSGLGIAYTGDVIRNANFISV